MKLSKKLKLAAIFTGAIAIAIPFSPAMAQFKEQPIPEGEAIAVAVPAGAVGYNLNVVQQIPGKQQCFAEQGSEPTIVDPLWTTFDFTGSCVRSADGNGYSVFLDGEDKGLEYRLDVVKKGDDLQLVANSYSDGSKLVVGQSFGQPAKGEYAKIYLNPGWELTKKTFEGKVLGPFFLSGDTQAIAAAGGQAPTPPKPTAQASFNDINRDIYKDEIENAVALGFIAGYKDKTFRPSESLTREQIVSMAYGALETIESVQLGQPPSVPIQPYPDVDSGRWSAAKIQWAKESGIVKGYPDGSFQPEKPVSRAELITILENMATFANSKPGQAALVTNQEPKNFTDVSGHWGAEKISTMSAYCGVASPYQETGNAFQPDSPASRNYAAAATLRTHNCLTGTDSADKDQVSTEEQKPMKEKQ